MSRPPWCPSLLWKDGTRATGTSALTGSAGLLAHLLPEVSASASSLPQAQLHASKWSPRNTAPKVHRCRSTPGASRGPRGVSTTSPSPAQHPARPLPGAHHVSISVLSLLQCARPACAAALLSTHTQTPVRRHRLRTPVTDCVQHSKESPCRGPAHPDSPRHTLRALAENRVQPDISKSERLPSHQPQRRWLSTGDHWPQLSRREAFSLRPSPCLTSTEHGAVRGPHLPWMPEAQEILNSPVVFVSSKIFI